MASRGLNTLVLLCAAGICAEAFGFMKLAEGWANVDIVVATSDVVVCSRRVSGAQDELFALDTVGKKVLWRKSGYAVTRGETDGRGNFVVVDLGETLVSRKLKDGEVNWQKSIGSAVPNSYTERPASQDSNLNASRKVRYKYRGPFVRGEKAFVFRQGLEGPPDAGLLLFDDWLVFDTGDGQLLHHGSDACMGLAGDVLVVRKESNSIIGIDSSDYREHPVYRKETTGALAAIAMDQGPAGGSGIQYSYKGKCLFYIDVRASENKAVVYDSSSRKLTVLEAGQRADWQTDWILLSNCIVRYSVRTMDAQKTLPGWIEVYDLDGKPVREYGFERAVGKGEAELEFAGTSGNGSVIFARSGRMLVFDLPSLEVTADVKRKGYSEKGSGPWGDIFIKMGSDVIYVVEGNRVFEKMGRDQVAHKISVNLVSLKTGETLWAHTEEVVIKKKQPES